MNDCTRLLLLSVKGGCLDAWQRRKEGRVDICACGVVTVKSSKVCLRNANFEGGLMVEGRRDQGE